MRLFCNHNQKSLQLKTKKNLKYDQVDTPATLISCSHELMIFLGVQMKVLISLGQSMAAFIRPYHISQNFCCCARMISPFISWYQGYETASVRFHNFGFVFKFSKKNLRDTSKVSSTKQFEKLSLEF